MARSFKRLLRSRRGLPGVGPVWKVFEEVSCTRGRPDFVAIVRRPKHPSRDRSSSLNMAACSVLALLRPRRPLGLAALVSKSGLSDRIVKSALGLLVRAGYAKRGDRATFVLAPGEAISSVESWAFELKLRNTKRAIFQAQQYRLFAQRVVIVVPPQVLGSYSEHAATLGRWGIGVATFDPVCGDFCLARRPRRGRPVSIGQQIYVVSRMVNGGGRKVMRRR